MAKVVNQTLASLSLDAFDIMNDDVMYTVFRHAFPRNWPKRGGRTRRFTLRDIPVNVYADTLVQEVCWTRNILESAPQPLSLCCMYGWIISFISSMTFSRACTRGDDQNEFRSVEMHLIVPRHFGLGLAKRQEANDKDTGIICCTI